MTRAALALGGNVGDVAAAFVLALRSLQAHPQVMVLARSSVYRTPPWGVTDQPDFLNMAALVDTQLTPRELLALSLSIEREGGRVRDLRWGPRRIDIDVIAFGDETIDEPDLTVPHPRAAERAFVLMPLAEIAPDLTLGGTRVDVLLARLDAAGIGRDPAADRALERGGV